MYKYFFVLYFVFSLFSSAFSQQVKKVEFEILYKADMPEYMNEIEINGIALYINNELKKTFTRSSFEIFKFDEKYGVLKHNIFTFDRQELQKAKGKIPFKIIFEKNEYNAFLKIPVIVALGFEKNTNILKRGEKLDIKLFAKYNNNKSLPISYNLLDIKTSKGSLKDGHWSLNIKDIKTQKVTMLFCLKSNPKICIEKTFDIKDKDDPYWDDIEDEEDDE